ncbi:MAG: pentapeptide repeat-containing protein [Clostridiales bacterium]|nr:pentapeptide repeat-containing protein [Clostridiales bacterium]
MSRLENPKIPEQLERTGDFSALLRQAQREESALRNFCFSHAGLLSEKTESADFRGCVFENCRLTGCLFSNAYFSDAVFKSCDLSNSDFSRSVFRRVRFENCKAVGAVFSESVWEHAEIRGSHFQMANLPSSVLKNVRLHDSDFSGCGFQQCRFKELCLESCRLIRADFLHTPLCGVDFTDCEIDGIVLSGEELRGAVVTPVQACDLARYLGLIVR